METKICRVCEKELPSTTEYFSKCGKGGKWLNKRCKKCCCEYAKQYYKGISENLKHIEYGKQYYYDHKEYRRQYYYDHREELNKKKRERYKTGVYKLSHRIRRARRRSLERSVASSFTVEDWTRCKESFDNKCAYCNKEGELQQEHFISLTRGGEYTINNIIPACKSCNCSKCNRDFFEWYPAQEFYDKKREQKILIYLHYNKNREQQLALII
jgi:5-methylcytosine-specific restriction endonuclease McrA